MICQYQYCAKEFIGRPNKRFCSNTCRTYHAHGNTTIPGLRERSRIANAPKNKIWVRTCPSTGILFTTQHSNKLYHDSAPNRNLIKRIEGVCGCGNTYSLTNGVKRLMCTACRIKDDHRLNKTKRRAIEHGRYADNISSYQVFKRDGWKCKLCGIPTPWSLRGKGLPNSPELDHRIPISKSGDHVWCNVQCLCRSCNNIKQDRLDFKFNNITRYQYAALAVA